MTRRPRASPGSTWTRTWNSGRRTSGPWRDALARPGALACGPERVPGPVRGVLAGPLVLRRLGAAARGAQRAVRPRRDRAQRGGSRPGGQPPAAARRRPRRLPGRSRPDERVIVPGARVVVHVPRTAGDLLRRRVRAAMGVDQVEAAEGAPEASARTRPRDLLAMIRARAAAGAAGGGVPRGRRAGPAAGRPRSPAESVLDLAARREQPQPSRRPGPGRRPQRPRPGSPGVPPWSPELLRSLKLGGQSLKKASTIRFGETSSRMCARG